MQECLLYVLSQGCDLLQVDLLSCIPSCSQCISCEHLPGVLIIPWRRINHPVSSNKWQTIDCLDRGLLQLLFPVPHPVPPWYTHSYTWFLTDLCYHWCMFCQPSCLLLLALLLYCQQCVCLLWNHSLWNSHLSCRSTTPRPWQQTSCCSRRQIFLQQRMPPFHWMRPDREVLARDTCWPIESLNIRVKSLIACWNSQLHFASSEVVLSALDNWALLYLKTFYNYYL